VLLAKELHTILNVLGLTRPSRAGLELMTSWMLSESTITRLLQPVFFLTLNFLQDIWDWWLFVMYVFSLKTNGKAILYFILKIFSSLLFVIFSYHIRTKTKI
jgi:hypothetical protein